MPVEFEWRIEQPGPEPTGAGSAGHLRRPWCRWAWPLAVAILLLALGCYLWRRERLRALEQPQQAVLEVARLEWRAAASGDTELFLSLQDQDDPAWYAMQRARILAGEPLPPPVPGLSATLPLTVEHATVVGRRARVEFVRLAGVPGEPMWPFRGLAFYRQAEDGRWVHTADDPDYAGRTLVWVGPRNEVAGQIAHTELMEGLASDLELRADAFCVWVACPPGPRFTLALTGTLRQTSPPSVLPAPHLVGVPEGDAARDVWIQALGRLMADRMLDQTVGQPNGGALGQALRSRVRQYLGVEPSRPPNPAALGAALSGGWLPTLEQLWEGHLSAEQSAVARDEAALFVRFVERQYGQSGVAALLQASAAAPTLEALTAAALGAELANVEGAWLAYLADEVSRQIP